MNVQGFAVPVEDQVPFLKFVAYVLQVDGSVSEEEQQALGNLVAAWKLSADAVKEVFDVLERGSSVESLCAQFTNEKTGYLLVQELITLASIDENYGENEKKAIDEIAAHCGVSKTRVAALEKWVKEGIEWRQQGLVLVTPEGK